MDLIEIKGIRSYGYTGYFSEEQFLGQWFEVDVIVGIDLQKPGISDNLDDTLDYRSVISSVKQRVSTSKYALIEKLIEVIAEDILKISPIEEVTIRLTKVSPPIPEFGGHITLQITRSKER
jgi:dihydroneopterin aldolase